MWLLDIGKAIIDLVASPIKDWSSRRTLKAETDAKVAILEAEARVKQAERLVTAEIDWDAEAMRQTEHSWKDEWFALLLSAPFIASFIPGLQDYTIKGWEYLGMAPDWYRYAFLGAVCASFGLRWAMKGFFKK